jgi:hypothetical protein
VLLSVIEAPKGAEKHGFTAKTFFPESTNIQIDSSPSGQDSGSPIQYKVKTAKPAQ